LLELGDVATAEKRAVELLDLLRAADGDALEEADALLHLGRARYLSFQASLLAERTGQTLMAAGLAEQPRELYEELGDRRSLACILNNLGGLNWLLCRTEVAFEMLRDAFETATDVGSPTDGAQAISSLVLPVSEVRNPEGRAAVLAEPGQLRHVERLHPPLGPEEVLAVAGRVEPAVERRAGRARAALGDVEVLAEAAAVARRTRDLPGVAAARRVRERLAAFDLGSLQPRRHAQER
jgi:hypothetical protein